MSVRRIAFASVSLLLFCRCGILYAQARAENNPQQLLRDLEQRWLDSEDNPDALESVLADDFIHVLPSGFVTKREQLQYMRSHPATQPGTRKHFEDLRIRIYHDAGIVNGIVVATDAAGKVRKTIFTDVFALRNGKWRAINAQELPLSGRQ